MPELYVSCLRIVFCSRASGKEPCMHDPLHGLPVTHEYFVIMLSVGSKSACSV